MYSDPAAFDAPSPLTGRTATEAAAAETVEVELAAGEGVRIGGLICTVVDVGDGEVHLRVDPAHAPAAFEPREIRFAGAAR